MLRIRLQVEKEWDRCDAYISSNCCRYITHVTLQVEKEWEATREQRVGTWRDFMNKKGPKAVGEFKPPKLKANDEDKLYVR